MSAKAKLITQRIAIIVGIIILPLIYSITYLNGFWDPYNNLGDIKVAVVNEDQCQTDCKSTQLIKKLQNSDSFNFTEQNAQAAEEGLHDRTYYATITIPSDFTASFDQAGTKERHSPTIVYRPNNKSNYITSQLIHNAVMQMEMSLDQEVAATVTGELSGRLQSIPSQLNTLSDGLGRLQNGSSQLANGTAQLQNGTQQLAQNYLLFNNGLNGFRNGAVQLAQGSYTLSQSSQSIQTGLQQSSTGAQELSSGAQSLQSGYEQYDAGMQKLSSGLHDLNTQTAPLGPIASQLPALSSAFSTYKTQSDRAYDAAAQAYQLLTAYYESTPAAQSDPRISNAYQVAKAYLDSGGLTQLKTSNQSLQQSFNQLGAAGSNIQALVTAINTLDQGGQELAANSQTIKNSVAQLQAGSQQLSNGLNLLNSNYPKFHQGLLSLNQGAQQLSSGSGTLNNASQRIQTGINSLNGGTSSLRSGSEVLRDGISTAKTEVEAKADSAASQSSELDGLSNYVKQPVQVKNDGYGQVNDYGTFFSPFFISLSLWLGGILIMMGLYYDPDSRFKVLGRNSPNRPLRLLIYTALGVVQALVLATVLHWALGFEVSNWPLFYGSCILISLSFLMMIMFLFFNFGDVGKFIALVLLVVQLAACNGTFPIEVEPTFFSAISKFMPMTYSVALLRESFVTIEQPLLAHNAAVLVVLGLVFAALVFTFGLAKTRGKKISLLRSSKAHQNNS